MSKKGPLTGKTFGEYTLGDLLGAGGFGQVYKAKHGPYAIKVLLEEYTQDEKSVRRFIEEGRWLAHMNHPNIIKILDMDVEKNRIYMVMPYIKGTLLKQVNKKVHFGLKGTKRYLKQICDALDHVHEKGGVHLDIKPANILCDGNKSLFLSDFGLAHLIGHYDGKTGLVRLDKSRAKTSMRMGTLHYMAPERLAWRPEKRSDIYSVGVMLFEMLTGKVPFDGSAEEILDAQLSKHPPKIEKSTYLPGSWHIDPVIRKAMAKKPEDRYSTAGKLYKAFSEAVKEFDE